MTSISSTPYYAGGNRYADTGTTNSSARGKAPSEDGAYTSVVANQNAESNGTKSSDNRVQTSTDPRASAAAVNFQAQLLNLNPTSLTSALKGTPVWELPDDVYQGLVSSRETFLERDHTQFPEPPDLSNYAGTKPYSTVVVGGKVVATIDNQGGVSSDDVLGQKLRDLLVGDVNGTNGPDLAQARADQIAKLVGGRVVKSDTALTQAQFTALPKPETAEPWVDYDAMRADPEYDQIQQIKQKRAEYLASQ